ncbi:two-component system, regulatory protein [Nitratireductor pacificus pht-3B]|uniref:Two-component system, regulatory protein n=2 Tax=Nitratireductor TaxID=245876 RepID=K2N8Z3_9HYPH|nr:two-component system, regulatory protein [Nitratireductor pacificus pht-3B]
MVSDHSAQQAACTADLGQVLVVAASPINRIVLSRIAERAYLKASAMEPGEAGRTLAAAAARDRSPGLVIVDMDAALGNAGSLIDLLSALRSASPRRLPLVIGVVSSCETATLPALQFDATVVRPVTPETLQPVIERLIAGARG